MIVEGRVAAWLQIIGNISVLCGLVLVAIQISQNTEIARAQIANDFFIADMNLELAMMGENPQEAWIKAVYHPEELTESDAAVIDRYFNYGLIQLDRLEEMRELGLAFTIDPAQTMRWHLGNEVARRWWQEVKNQGWYARVQDSIDAGLGDDVNSEILNSLLPRNEP